MPTVWQGDPAAMAAWLRKLADLVEGADGSVVLRLGSFTRETMDVTAWGDTFRQYAPTGRWSVTLEIDGVEGVGEPWTRAALPPTALPPRRHR